MGGAEIIFLLLHLPQISDIAVKNAVERQRVSFVENGEGAILSAKRPTTITARSRTRYLAGCAAVILIFLWDVNLVVSRAFWRFPISHSISVMELGELQPT